MKTFSIREAIRFGWAEFKKHSWVYIAMTIVTMIISAMSSARYIGIIFWLGSIIAQMGFLKISLNVVDGKKPEIEDLFTSWKYFIKYAVTYMLLGAVILIPALILVLVFGVSYFAGGFTDQLGWPIAVAGIVFIIFAFWVTLRYMFVPYLIMDDKAKIMESFKMSSKITKGNKAKLLLFIIALVGVNLLGILALVVGLLVSTTVTRLASAYVYRKLLAQTSTHTSASATTDAHAETHKEEHSHTHEHMHGENHSHTNEHEHAHKHASTETTENNETTTA